MTQQSKKKIRFLVVTFAPTLSKDGKYASYAPYVNEMNIWFKHADEVAIISPFSYNKPLLLASFECDTLKRFHLPSISFSSFFKIFRSVILLPYIFLQLVRAMLWASHIHLRCPGNISLLGCLVQICFPHKMKTAKYAGNWDPLSKQPASYRLQKWILSNTFLTRNMSVLVYGKWKNQTKNITSFFTATFRQDEIEKIALKTYDDTLKFVYVGSLVSGKRPLLAIQIVEQLRANQINVHLELFGEGVLRNDLDQYINENELNNFVFLRGNQDKATIKKVLKTAHFSILPSKSEGWPKALAEAMFFGVIPISTEVSCVPWMLDFGKRGILIEPDLQIASNQIMDKLNDYNGLTRMSKLATEWSQNYTLDRFESEIIKLLT